MNRNCCFRLSVLLACLFAALFFDSKRVTAADSPIAKEVESLQADYKQKDHAAFEALHAAKTREEGIKLYIKKRPNPATYVAKLIDLAKSDPTGPGGFEALIAAVDYSNTSWKWKDEPVRPDLAIEMLTAGHIENPKLAETFPSLKDLLTKPSRELLRQAAEKNPSRDVRGQALFYLAENQKEHAEILEICREVPAFKARLDDNGSDWMANLFASDPKDLHAHAIELLERARKEFADIKAGEESIGAQADRSLFQLQKLDIGQIAPEITGNDQNGVPMKLSDYRGKVVALVFWAGWCGPCMAEVPAERELVKRMQGKPFVLLGINNDEPADLKAVLQKHQINWRSWTDGSLDSPHPIAKAWNVRPWPKIYVLDRAGVIRFNQLAYGSGNELAQAVDELVNQIH
ncbi:MAG TPA: TlpA disulfide reductase family protein [Tepidisphaeraceae bacterium]|jgi:peroxiredoxin